MLNLYTQLHVHINTYIPSVRGYSLVVLGNVNFFFLCRTPMHRTLEKFAGIHILILHTHKHTDQSPLHIFHIYIYIYIYIYIDFFRFYIFYIWKMWRGGWSPKHLYKFNFTSLLFDVSIHTCNTSMFDCLRVQLQFKRSDIKLTFDFAMKTKVCASTLCAYSHHQPGIQYGEG